MYRLLIVEDDCRIASAIREQTKMWDLDAHIVEDFRSVLIDFTAYQPHIVLLDIGLPFFNGYYWCSENVGEKPPKGNWFIGIIGLLLLGTAYYLAVTIQDPVAALVTFFVAVVMVIIGTYLTMIAGSVLFCRILQKKKSYYYKPNHFVSVSSMVYRMKRNGAGLASICILATMVLVMMASTACLYFGEESAINMRYPRDINLEFHVSEGAALSDSGIQILKDGVSAELEAYHVIPENGYFYRSANIYGVMDGNTVEADSAKIDTVDAVSSICRLFLPPCTLHLRFRSFVRCCLCLISIMCCCLQQQRESALSCLACSI